MGGRACSLQRGGVAVVLRAATRAPAPASAPAACACDSEARSRTARLTQPQRLAVRRARAWIALTYFLLAAATFAADAALDARRLVVPCKR
eukprot:scaffold22464_cov101-Isochrysis_galbana.AAC.1